MREKTFKKKKSSLIDFELIELTIDDDLSMSFAIVVKLNKSIFVFVFVFFFLHKSMSLLSIKKNVRQSLDAMKNIKAIELIEQQLKTI